MKPINVRNSSAAKLRCAGLTFEPGDNTQSKPLSSAQRAQILMHKSLDFVDAKVTDKTTKAAKQGE